MTGWYQSTIVDTGREGPFWLVLAFLATFVVVRLITRRIRGRDGHALRDVVIGGLHIHHQVWGILLVLLAGALVMFFLPGSPWMGVLGALFGIGAALTLDEFALWFYMEDVYWDAKGRASIDAVLIAALLGVLLLLGLAPFETNAEARAVGRAAATGLVVTHVLLAVVCALKGKPFLAVTGIFVPGVALVGAVRLAVPGSPWAAVAYRGARAHRLERAEKRFGPEWRARRDRLLDLIGGAPTEENDAAGKAGPPAGRKT